LCLIKILICFVLWVILEETILGSKKRRNMALNRGCRAVTIDVEALASSIERKMPHCSLLHLQNPSYSLQA
jgi:hypothetical protein